MYERLTDRQKDLLRELVKGVRDKNVHEPFQGVYLLNGNCYIDGVEKHYEMSLKGDLQILDEEGFLSSTYTSRGNSSYTLLQTAYDAADNNFQESTQTQKTSRNIQSDEAFIICAFMKELEPICAVIKSVAAKHDLTAHRVDDYEEDFQITEKIIQQIEEAKIIIADLSFERPNVYFEYGYARGAGRTGSIITLLSQGETAHFDVKDWNQITYDPDNLESLEHKLAKRITALLSKQE